MKIRIVLTVLLGSLLLACSSDDGDEGSNSIVGTWDLTSIELEGNTEEEQAAELFISLLAAQDCYLLTLIFREGDQATLQSSLDYLDLEGVFPGGPALECPAEKDSESATYVYENGQLSITDSEGFTVTIDVTLSGDRLTVDLDGSDFEDFGTSGSMTFERR
jgi:hypothetical protein